MGKLIMKGSLRCRKHKEHKDSLSSKGVFPEMAILLHSLAWGPATKPRAPNGGYCSPVGDVHLLWVKPPSDIFLSSCGTTVGIGSRTVAN